MNHRGTEALRLFKDKPSVSPCLSGKSDPRHQALMEEIDFLYKRYNDDLPAPDMGRTAKALAQFLKANPGWPVARIVRALRNRFYSRGVNYSEAPWAWTRYLPMYVWDPLDEWKKPMRGMGDSVQEYWENEVERLKAE